MAIRPANEQEKREIIDYVRMKIDAGVSKFDLESNSLEYWLVLDARVLRDWMKTASLSKFNKLVEIKDNAPHLKRIVFERTSCIELKPLIEAGRLEKVGKRTCNWVQGEQLRADSKPNGKRNGGKAGHKSDYSYIDATGKRVRVEVKHRGGWFYNEAEQEEKDSEKNED